MSSHEHEIRTGQRFEFGKNWHHFLNSLSESKIKVATDSLVTMLDMDELSGKSFLDIGCGSGIFSLSARRLGAMVHSFDFDPASVACAEELRRRFFPDDSHWTIAQGSVLDREYLESLGQFDVVYSWGVLHHTGSMHEAFKNVLSTLNGQGRLFISIYNDQGRTSSRWKKIKQFYCALPNRLKTPFTLMMMAPRESKLLLRSLLTLRPQKYLRLWTNDSGKRGMNRWHDQVDWLGGFPFEVAKPEEVVHVFREAGLILEKLKTVGGGSGCNEFVFRKHAALRRAPSEPPTNTADMARRVA